MSVRSVSFNAEPNRAFRSPSRLLVEGVLAEVLRIVRGRRCDLSLSFFEIRMMTSLMVAGCPGARPGPSGASRARSRDGGPPRCVAVRGRPHADDGVGARGRAPTCGHSLTPPRPPDLQHERVRVVGGHVVLAATLVAEADGRAAHGLSMLMPSKLRRGRRRTGRRPGPTNVLPPPLTGATAPSHTRFGIVFGPTFVRGDRHVVGDPAGPLELAVVPVGLLVQVVRLDEVDVRIVDRRHRRRRVQERVRVAELRVDRGR